MTAQSRTAIRITCDTENIPIYLDNYLVGYTPLTDNVDVLPGWHKISIFPNMGDTNQKTRKLTDDILRLGSQDILIGKGEIIKVTIPYNSINQDVDIYYKSTHTGTIFGFSMVVALIFVIVWAYG